MRYEAKFWNFRKGDYDLAPPKELLDHDTAREWVPLDQVSQLLYHCHEKMGKPPLECVIEVLEAHIKAQKAAQQAREERERS